MQGGLYAKKKNGQRLSDASREDLEPFHLRSALLVLPAGGNWVPMLHHLHLAGKVLKSPYSA